jgi:hypothetical protein
MLNLRKKMMEYGTTKRTSPITYFYCSWSQYKAGSKLSPILLTYTW